MHSESHVHILDSPNFHTVFKIRALRTVILHLHSQSSYSTPIRDTLTTASQVTINYCTCYYIIIRSFVYSYSFIHLSSQLYAICLYFSIMHIVLKHSWLLSSDLFEFLVCRRIYTYNPKTQFHYIQEYEYWSNNKPKKLPDQTNGTNTLLGA